MLWTALSSANRLSESTVTFSGDPKPLFYEENKEQFREFEDRIIHVVVDDTPMECDAYARDHHQKCAVARGLKDAKDDDIVIFSDVDEIPNPQMLENLLPDVEPGKIYMPAQRLFYCYLNLEDISGNNLSVTGEFGDRRACTGRRLAFFVYGRRQERVGRRACPL